MIISIGLPIGLFLFLRKRMNLKVVPMLVGAVAFVVFALILESLLHQLVLRPDADGTIALLNNPLLYMLYGCFAAGIFEESARFISFRLLKKKYSGVRTGFSYGIGHGGIEAILLAGLAMLSNIVLSIMMNTGATAALGNSPEILAGIATLQETDSYLFLVSGIERISAVVIQISLSLLVWFSVNRKGKGWLFPAAIVLHAVIDAPAALMQAGAISSIALVELLVAVAAVVLAVLAYFACKRFKNDDAAVNASENLYRI